MPPGDPWGRLGSPFGDKGFPYEQPCSTNYTWLLLSMDPLKSCLWAISVYLCQILVPHLFRISSNSLQSGLAKSQKNQLKKHLCL